MAPDAVRALRHVRDRNCDELLGLRRQCSIGEDALAERPERSQRFWRQLLALLRELSRSNRIHLLFHVVSLVGKLASAPMQGVDSSRVRHFLRRLLSKRWNLCGVALAALAQRARVTRQ